MFFSGNSKSVKEAAKKFGVNDSVLNKYVKNGSKFKGKGIGKARFSVEEEFKLKEKILKATENGSKLSVHIIRDFIQEEASRLSALYPSRSETLSKFVNPAYCDASNFAKKHGLTAIIRKNDNIDERSIYECDLCTKKFTYKNTVTKHRKKVHHGFLVS